MSTGKGEEDQWIIELIIEGCQNVQEKPVLLKAP